MCIYFLSFPSFRTLSLKTVLILIFDRLTVKTTKSPKGTSTLFWFDVLEGAEENCKIKFFHDRIPKKSLWMKSHIQFNSQHKGPEFIFLNENESCGRVKLSQFIIRALGSIPKRLAEYLWSINSGIELAALNSKKSVSGISKDPPKGLWRRLVATWWWDWNFRYGHTCLVKPAP